MMGVGPSVQVVWVLCRNPGPLHGEGVKRSGLSVCPRNKVEQLPTAGGRLTGVVNPVATGETLSCPPGTVGTACPNTFTDPVKKASPLELVPPVMPVDPAIALVLPASAPPMTAPTLRGVSRSDACFGRDVRKGVQAIATRGSSDKDWSKLEFFEGLSSVMSVMSCSTRGSVL